MTLNGIDGVAYTRGPGTWSVNASFMSAAERTPPRYGWLLECMFERGEDPGSCNGQTLSRRAPYGTFYRPEACQSRGFKFYVLASPRPDTTLDDA